MQLQNVKISLKELINNKLYAIINIGGLTLSFTILILLFLHKEPKVNKQQINLTQLYGLNYNVTDNAYSSVSFGKLINNKDFTDSSFIEKVSAKIIEKDKNDFLQIGESSAAKKIYEEDLLNQTIKFDNKSEHFIEVKLEDYPPNSRSIHDYISRSPSTFFIPIYNNKL